jgi:hypothetical protein
MTALYFDTRLKNRAFHNMSDLPLNPEQQKILALNPKFVPRPPRATKARNVSDALDNFDRRLRL